MAASRSILAGRAGDPADLERRRRRALSRAYARLLRLADEAEAAEAAGQGEAGSDDNQHDVPADAGRSTVET